MYDDDFDDDDLPIVAETEVTKEQIKRGLLDGRWKIHCRDANGVTWFVQNDAPAPPIDDFVDDVVAGSMIADRPAAEPEPFDIRAAEWYGPLHQFGTVDIDWDDDEDASDD